MRVRADFEGGNVESPRVVSEREISFLARRDSSPQPLWFNFIVEDIPAPATVTFELRNASKCLGVNEAWPNARPVYRECGTHQWQRINNVEYLADKGVFRFTQSFQSSCVQIAYCYPYTTQEFEKLWIETDAGNILKKENIGLTGEGRPLPVYFGGIDPDQCELGVWLMARSHSGEVSGSWVLDGFLRWFCSEEAGRLGARDVLSVGVVPFLDLDGVVNGFYGKNRAPVDFNRDWESVLRPEIRSVQAALEKWAHRIKRWVSFDLHAPHHGDAKSYFIIPLVAANYPALERSCRKVAALIGQEFPEEIGFSQEEDIIPFPPEWITPGQLGTPSQCYIMSHHGVPALGFEASYHLCRSGEYTSIPMYQKMGAAFGRGLLRYLDAV